MRKGILSREQAINTVGFKLIEDLDATNCDYTNRLMPDSDAVEFAAKVNYTDSDGIDRVLTAYYYQMQEDLDGCEDLCRLAWVIDGYDIQ